MRYRLLGQTGLRISELFLGAMNFGEQDGGRTRLPEIRDILDVYLDAGGNVVDTAVNYGGGESEQVLGEVLEGRRDRLVLATKYTCARNTSDPNAAGNHRKNLTLSLETSLRRLRTDYIDLYWVHVWDRHTPIEEMMRALDDAVRAGKILYVGISDAPAWVVSRANTLAQWRDWTPFVGLQVPYNLLERDIERELLPMAEAFGMTVATWSPLAHGLLSGRHTRPDSSAAGSAGAVSDGADPLGAGSLSGRERAAVRAVQDVADELGVSAAQVAIAWTRAASRAVHPIIGVSSVRQLRDNLGAVDVVLPAEAVARLSAAVEFTAGFPADFIAECEQTPWVAGLSATHLDGR
ncbi:aldo/keto reductase [Plantactinospora soyae]|uniref:Aryl-alcohol dehydrogenase-like predicted oxidoreductase n=1 Tax=Plantactinospora soyae TaxID=1544732 RepID=A0A927M7N1_9ACTN|nr:aldo/keto reductase [Plantactinospora soyae]MBE1488547.1 aryl-alcohol dehydrogenase-like predicted oxidoreductase [Plantactinospora soyae]